MRALTVTPTGRRLAHGGPPEVVVDVDTTSAPAEARLDDGLRLAFDGTRLVVDGPDRDLLVRADGRPVTRLRAGSATVDLSASVELRAEGGRPAYDEHALRAAADTDASTGLRHRYDIRPDPPGPGEPCTVRVRVGELGNEVVAVRVTTVDPFGTAGVAPGGSFAARPAEGDVWEATLPGHPAGTVVRYEVHAGLADGTVRPIADAGAAFAWPRPSIAFVRPPRTSFSYAVGPAPVPDWWRDGVVYHVLVDRFAGPRGEPVDAAAATSLLGFAGGTIDGLTARLDHVADLGATILLVSPLTPGEMHVCYDVKHHTAVEPRVGTEGDVLRLCQEAHRRGIRIVLDTEISYLGMRHPKAGDAAWTVRADDGRPLGWLGGNPTFVPVDHFHAEARTHLLDALRWWVGLGVDGFRMDSAHATAFDMWTDVGAALRAVDPDIVTIAEGTQDASFCHHYRGRLTGFLDFAVEAALRGLCGDGTVAPSEAAATFTAVAELPSGLSAPAFFECHDGARFGLLAGGDRRRTILATTLLVSLPGPPILYYGTEVGMTQTERGEMDLLARRPMHWSNHDAVVLDGTRAAIGRRRSSAALRRGTYRTVHADDEAGLLTFERHDPASGERVLVVANVRDAGTRKVTLPTVGPTSIAPLTAVIMEASS